MKRMPPAANPSLAVRRYAAARNDTAHMRMVLEVLALARAASQVVRAEPMSTLDAELNDFGAQLAMLGGHAADRDG